MVIGKSLVVGCNGQIQWWVGWRCCGDPIPWLIALTFFFARGFIKTGLKN